MNREIKDFAIHILSYWNRFDGLESFARAYDPIRFLWMNVSIMACEARIGARTVSVPSRSMISAMVLRFVRVSLSIWICIIIKNPLTRVLCAEERFELSTEGL